MPEDHEELRLAIAAALGLAPDRCGEEQATDAYRYLLVRVWERMQAVVGVSGARAILLHAVKIAATRCPEAALIVVRDEGLDLSRLEIEPSKAGREKLCRCLKELYQATYLTVRELTGELVVGPMLDELSNRRVEPGT